MTTLRFLPCLDSPERADRCRADLDVARNVARQLGESTVHLSEQGFFETAAGRRVDIADAVARAQAATVSIRPDDPLPAAPGVVQGETTVQVTNETTLVAGHRLVRAGSRPLALNFANGIQPGGGFLNGARAQEEVLCRSSALYMALRGDPMYDAHMKRAEPDSTAWSILSPDVPVFRTDDGTALDEPWLLSFITCAAPVAYRVGPSHSAELLAERIRRVLEIGAAYGYTDLVLGAWGCGAFGNDPRRTAQDFRAALEGPYAGQFDQVVFAIADWSQERRYLGPFRDVMTSTAGADSTPRDPSRPDERPSIDLSRLSHGLLGDTWVKLLENHQQNFALIVPSDPGCRLVFFSDHLGVFDELALPDSKQAESALRRNGFVPTEHGTYDGLFGDITDYFSGSEFHARPHPNGRIYSSGRYWV